MSELCYCNEAQNVTRVANKGRWAPFNVKLHFLVIQMTACRDLWDLIDIDIVLLNSQFLFQELNSSSLTSYGHS